MITATLLACTPVVVDGDTLRLPCTGERVRLIAIDSCETHAKQRIPGCTRAKGEQATRALQTLIAHKPLRIERIRIGAWGRTDALVWAGDKLVNCALVEGGWAIYLRRFDAGERVAKLCEAAR